MPTNSPMMAGSGWCATGHLQKREIMTDIGPVAVAARACATAAAKVASASAFRRRFCASSGVIPPQADAIAGNESEHLRWLSVGDEGPGLDRDAGGIELRHERAHRRPGHQPAIQELVWATSCRRATRLIVMLGSNVSSTIHAFSDAVQRKRRWTRCDDLNSIGRIAHRHGCMPHPCQVGDHVRSVRRRSHWGYLEHSSNTRRKKASLP